MPSEYKAHGIQLQYPENWTCEEKSAPDSDTVMLSAPGGGFWMLSVFPRSESPVKVMDGVARSLSDDYDSLEKYDAEEELDGFATTGYDFAFIYLDLVNTAKTRGLVYDDKTYVVFYQAEDREFQSLEPVFQAVFVSFLRNLP